MQCMVPGCRRGIAIHRRAANYWFCSGKHFRMARDLGVIAAIHKESDNPNRRPEDGPLTPMRCKECGRRIGFENRLRGRWFCGEGCFAESEKPPLREPDPFRRMLVGFAGVAFVGVAAWSIKSGSGERPVPPPTPPPGPAPPLLPPGEHHFGFGNLTEITGQWGSGAWEQTADGLWRPLRSMVSQLAASFTEGTVEFTAKGGIGFLFRATGDLSSFHSISFRPVRNPAGRIKDYRLERANWIAGQIDFRWPDVILDTRPNWRKGQDSFRILKQGDYFEAGIELMGGGWQIAKTWREQALAEGAVGLYVAPGHDYRIASGHIVS